MEVAVTLEPRGGGKALASTVVKYAGGNWSEVAFVLTPSEGTECVGMSYESANVAGISWPENNTYQSMSGGWGINSSAPGGLRAKTRFFFGFFFDHVFFLM
jgi:hypothetical protein